MGRDWTKQSRVPSIASVSLPDTPTILRAGITLLRRPRRYRSISIKLRCRYYEPVTVWSHCSGSCRSAEARPIALGEGRRIPDNPLSAPQETGSRCSPRDGPFRIRWKAAQLAHLGEIIGVPTIHAGSPPRTFRNLRLPGVSRNLVCSSCTVVRYVICCERRLILFRVRGCQ